MKKFFPTSFLVFILIFSCTEKAPVEQPLVIREDLTTLSDRTREIVASTAIETAQGIRVSLWATDSLAPDPVAMDIDDQGAVYLTRTNRQKNSEFDIRGYQQWMTRSIGFQTVEDRRTFLREEFAPERSEENSWHADLNNDSIHDWRDLAVERDEVWKLEDKDGDGQAEVSTRVVNDFYTEVTDVANAIHVRDNDLFVGIAPDMWRMEDTNGDQVYDKKESLATGFGIHIGFGGHGMSGAVMGPDGKLYWGIGDIGATITDKSGKIHKYPNQGVLVRSNTDGSDFEVFAHGLRNVHEFAFDEYGNIIGADNDGDHQGEKERLVHIVEGSDAGWRINWQFGKYQDPKNNSYKVWMDEKLHLPRWEGQAAYIIPPLANIHNGPTGMVYNPGHALGSRWQKHFFLVEFPGYPAGAHIWAFTLKAKGATFEMDQETDFMSGVLATGIRFGPEGALYATDWINGWNTKNYGRVWRFDVEEDFNDLKSERIRTLELMQADYGAFSQQQLFDLLSYGDQRIRQKAQFELVARGEKGLLIQATNQKDLQLARIHGIWGLGQLGARNQKDAEHLFDLLGDNDPEIIAQSLKVLGDLRYEPLSSALKELINHPYDRVKFYATQAAGRINHKGSLEAITAMIAANDDQDVYLRHAGILAMSRIANEQQLAALSNNEDFSLRLAAVLALRRQASPRLADFLDDEDEYIVTEAARAIHDDWSVENALPALAELLGEDRFTSEPLIRRAMSACLRVGGEENVSRLADYAANPENPSALRAEAINTLAYWQEPSLHDRVDGRYRELPGRDPSFVIARLTPVVGALISQQEVGIAAITAIGELGITDYNEALVQLVAEGSLPENRKAAVECLAQLNYENLVQVIELGVNDSDQEVRSEALSLLNQVDLDALTLSNLTQPIFVKGTLGEQQSVIQTLGKMDISVSGAMLTEQVSLLENGQLNPGLRLDLAEAIQQSKDADLIARVEASQSSGSLLEQYEEVLYGGNRRAGWQYFYGDATGQCTRCHALGGYGGNVGPDLTTIGKILTREQILEALVDPSARISPGYGMVSITLKDGQQITATLIEETEEQITLKTSEAEPLHIAKARIEKRTNVPSSMPPMGQIMSRRELRDLIEFLSGMGR